MADKIVYKGRNYVMNKYGHYVTSVTKNHVVTRHYIHRDIWEDNFGPIPEGYHVHHKDGDRLNNVIENLECVSIKEHSERHPGFAEWTRRDDVRKSHSKMMRRILDETPIRTQTCEICGKEFTYRQANGVPAKVCSNQCRGKKNRMTYTKTFVCAYCGKEFTRFIGHKRTFCSISCALFYRHRGTKQ